jgi:TPP-dependent pyruvate/acetoin dehydrogenase alpha subunit
MATGDAKPSGEHADWLDRHDPVLRLARELAKDAAAIARITALDQATRRRIDAAVAFALASPLPAAGAAFDHVFA